MQLFPVLAKRYAAVGVVLSAFALTCVGTSCSKRKPADEAREEAEEARRVGSQTKTSGSKRDRPDSPDRIIFMVADGMGTAALSGASYASESPLAMSTMEELNFVSTHSHEFVTTDSAASATAFATGSKTQYEAVSVEPGTTAENEEDPNRHLETLVEKAENQGWKTGLVSTVRIVHATPAAFGAHRAHRKSYEPIAGDLVDSGVDVLIGGGREYFTDREDGKNLLEEMEKGGYQRADSAEQFRAATGVAEQLVGLFRSGDAPPVRSGDREIGLAERTKGAISVLDRNNDDGFFLMVEGAQIDWRGHGLDGRGTIESTQNFDRAVGAALEYARDRDDTLVVVASDHETGGLSILGASQRERLSEVLGGMDAVEEQLSYRAAEDPPEDVPPVMPEMEVADGGDGVEAFVPVFGHLSLASRPYAEQPSEFWSIHTPEFVPMFAEGKGASYVADAGDNAAVGRRLEELVRGERSTRTGETSRGEPSSQEERPRNVVLFVGDGVGLDAWTAAHYGDGGLGVHSMPHKGLASARGPEQLVQDDAAAATVLATGHRTANGHLSVEGSSEGSDETLATVLERAERQGYRTGIATTGSLANPTVAAMYAHGGDLDSQAVASEFVGLPSRVDGADGVDVAYGGGRSAFDASVRKKLERRGVDVGTSWEEGGDVGRRVVRVLADDAMAPTARRAGDGRASDQPTLEEMTRAALEHLRAWHDPFFLVVEADGPGELQRGVDRSRSLVEAVAEFDEAVEVGRTFAERDGRTLVVATADAEQTLSVFDNHYGFADDVCGAAKRCGGPLELEPIDVATGKIQDAEGFDERSLQGEYGPPQIFLQYAWPVQTAAEKGEPGVHTANFVPVFASGPWSGRLGGVTDQTAIGALLERWVETGS